MVIENLDSVLKNYCYSFQQQSGILYTVVTSKRIIKPVLYMLIFKYDKYIIIVLYNLYIYRKDKDNDIRCIHYLEKIMHKFGISVYPDKAPIEKIHAYMEKAASLGYSRIFTCFLSVAEEEIEEYKKTFKEFSKKAHALGFEIAVDTHLEVFNALGATPEDISPFVELGVDIIRLDANFGAHKDVIITRNPHNVKIEFNASVDAGLGMLLQNGANKNQCIVCHNFYPERFTGLDLNLFNNLNQHWKSMNLRTAAFVSSNAKNTHGPWEVFCGLPTVEIYRGLPIDLQARHMLATGNIDDIIIGNAFASNEELEALANVNTQSIEVKVDVVKDIQDIEEEIAFTYAPHTNRIDYSSYFLRSTMTRIVYKGKAIPHRPCDKKFFTRGDVLVVNDNLEHYRGELQIVLQDIPNDGERNLIGAIKPEELILLDEIKPGFHYKLIK